MSKDTADTGIIIYTMPDCAACTQTKRKLASGGVPFTEQNFAEQTPEKQAQLKQDVGMRAPLVVTPNNGAWAGMNPGKIKEVIKAEGNASPSKAAPVASAQVSPARMRATH